MRERSIHDNASSNQLPRSFTEEGGLGHFLSQHGYTGTYTKTARNVAVVWTWTKRSTVNAPAITIGFHPRGRIMFSLINNDQHVGLTATSTAIGKLLDRDR